MAYVCPVIQKNLIKIIMKKPTVRATNEAIASATAIEKILFQNQDASMTVCESLRKGDSPNMLKVSITNVGAGGTSVLIPFGTLLGINGKGTTDALPEFTGTTGLFQDDAQAVPVNNLLNIDDNFGNGAKFLQDMNTRFFSRPVLITGFEVITPDTALGLSQRAKPLTLVDYPAQFEDSRGKKGTFVRQFTEITSAQILEKPVVFGMDKGAVYELLDGSTVDINIHFGAVDSPNFAPTDCGC